MTYFFINKISFGQLLHNSTPPEKSKKQKYKKLGGNTQKSSFTQYNTLVMVSGDNTDNLHIST